LLKESETKIEENKKSSAIFQMLFLSSVMTSTISGPEAIIPQKLFSEDELIPYKAKMLELLKRI